MSDKIEIKKDTFYKGSIAILAVLIIISIFTGGFGFGAGSSPGANANVVKTGGNTQQPVNMNVLQDTNLYPALGPKNAKHTVIEFSDFQCPYCAIASGLPDWTQQYNSGQFSDLFGIAGKIEKMAADGKIRVIYVSMSFLDDKSSTKESDWATEAALCANKQDKFWEMHKAIFTAQTQGENTGKFNKDKLEILAQGISGLDQAKFKSCLENDETLSDVQKIASTASQFASVTPTFYVDGKKVSASWSQISSLLN